jgi:hypothetical protein
MQLIYTKRTQRGGSEGGECSEPGARSPKEGPGACLRLGFRQTNGQGSLLLPVVESCSVNSSI